jgi:hypothetical protein
VVRVLGYRSGGPGSTPGTTRGKKVVGLERGPLSLVSATEELLDGKVAAPVYKIENTAIGIRHADHVAHSIRKKLAITSPTSGGRSVGVVCSRTQTMEFFFFFHTSTHAVCASAEINLISTSCLFQNWREIDPQMLELPSVEGMILQVYHC